MLGDSSFGPSEAGIDGLGFEGEDAEDAFVDTTQRFVADETLQGFNAESKFSLGKGALASKAPGAQTVQMLRKGVLWAVNDAEIFTASALYAGLHKSAPAFFDKA